VARIAALCAVAVWITSAFAGDVHQSRGQEAQAAADETPSLRSVTVLYNFGTNTGDPTQPHGQDVISQGRDGNLYSNAATGGLNGDGAAFSVTPSGTLSVVASLTAPHTGSGLAVQPPISGLFYVAGGANNTGPVATKSLLKKALWPPFRTSRGIHFFAKTKENTDS